jgi:hypothetical protein
MSVICPWCEERPATVITEPSMISPGGDRVCSTCNAEYEDEVWDWKHQSYAIEGYDGPQFADTMSGGCIQLSD